MACLLHSLPDRVASATSVTATTEASGLPATNLKTVQPGNVWRSTSVAAVQKVSIDLGAAYSIDVVSIIGANCTAAADTRVLVGNDPTFATNLYDSGSGGTHDFDQATINAAVRAAIPQLNHHALLPAAVSARYVQVWFDDATNPAGYIEVARILAGQAVEIDAVYPWLHGRDDLSEIARAEFSGTPYRFEKARPRTWKLKVGPSDEADAMDDIFDWIMTVKGKGGDLVVIPQSEVPSRFHQQAGYVWIKNFDALSNEFWNGWSGQLELVEWLP